MVVGGVGFFSDYPPSHDGVSTTHLVIGTSRVGLSKSPSNKDNWTKNGRVVGSTLCYGDSDFQFFYEFA